MATVNKDFKIKSGLIVEGTTATVNGFDVLTKKTADQDYIVNLIGGTATSANTANTVVKRDANGDFSAGDITADLIGNVTGTVSSLSNQNTDSLSEGNQNQYFTNQRALDATAAAYDASGAAATVAGDLTDHESDTSAHGVTGNVVGTSDTQTLTNKTIGDTLNFVGAGAMTISSDSHIVLTPAAGSSVKWGADVLATQGYADQAEADAKAYTDTDIAALVDSAPALLDTLNELAAAIGDNPNYATDLATSVGTKVSKAGDTMTGLLVLSADPSANLGAATKQYVDGEVSSAASTASQAAADALTDANAYTDTREGLITTAYQAYADALDTDDIAEATSLYFTDARAKSSAADLLTGASLSNITITGTGAGLTITAENGVAGSTTTDLAEGTNLYFTDERAVDALEAVVPNFTAVELNSVAKQVAATLSAPTAGIQVAHAFAKADYRSAEYLVKVAYGTHTEISKVLLTLDSSDNIAITEYGIVGTNGSASSVSAGISGSNVQLQVTTVNNNSTVTVVGTLVA
jgi:hypothetical protein